MIATTVAAAPSPAGAATQIGSTFEPTSGCGVVATFLQESDPPATPYVAPFDGVITSWAFHAGATTTALKFKVTRRAGPSGGLTSPFLIVAESTPQIPPANQTTTFPVRIPVLANDILGLHVVAATSGFLCRASHGAAGVHQLLGVDPAPGTIHDFQNPTGGSLLDVSAILERDADNDGFGDESQDQCPGAPGPNNGCPTTQPEPQPQAGDLNAPSATITGGPKDKTKKKAATFTFTGSDTRAVASFQCSLDGAAFAPCTSPHAVEVKKGKHTFQVRAVDDSGNVGSPASDDWKRKKRRS